MANDTVTSRSNAPSFSTAPGDEITITPNQEADNASDSTKKKPSMANGHLYKFTNRKTNLCLSVSKTVQKEKVVIQWKKLSRNSEELQLWIYESFNKDIGVLYPQLGYSQSLCLDRYEWAGKPLHNYADLWPRVPTNQDRNQVFAFDIADTIGEEMVVQIRQQTGDILYLTAESITEQETTPETKGKVQEYHRLKWKPADQSDYQRWIVEDLGAVEIEESEPETTGNIVWPTNLHSLQNDYPNYPDSNGNQGSTPHGGRDFPTTGPVYAAMDGEVTTAVFSYSNDFRYYRTDSAKAFGNYVTIQIEGGYTAYYAHMQYAQQPLVKKGDIVTAGTQIGVIGATGNTTGNHLHYEIRDANGKKYDPIGFLPTT